MNEQLSCHHFGSIGGVRGCLFCFCCHVWSLLSKKTTPTLPLLHRQAKKKVDSCSGYRPEIPDERAAAGGEGASGGASRLDLGGKRRSLRGPWGKRRSLRGVVHHIRSMGGSTRYVMTSFLLIPRRYSCRDQRRLAQINAKFGRDVLRSCVGACAPLTTTAFLSKYFYPDLPSTT
jgi:hypothetical protein